MAAIGTTYFIADSPYDVFYCSENNQVGMCHKISHDADNLSKRCYYDLNNTRKYNYCSSGWIIYENLNVTGEPINDSFKYFEAKFDKETISKLKNKGIENVEISPCIPSGPSCISELKILNQTYTLMIHYWSEKTSEQIEKKLIEEAKKELARLVAEEPNIIELTNPIKIELKEI